MNMDEIFARGRRAIAAGDEEGTSLAVDDLRSWLVGADGEQFLLGIMAPPQPQKRGWFRRSESAVVVLPVQRIAVPATMEPLGELRSSLVGACEDHMSEREIALVDGELLEWAEWDPIRRTLTTGDGVGVVVPEHVTIAQAAMGLLNCQVAMWPDVYLPEIEEDRE